MIAAAGIEELLFEIANALRIPVFIAATLALAILLFDLGTFFVELSRRHRGRGRVGVLQAASNSARKSLGAGDPASAERALMPLASSAQMAATLTEPLDFYGKPGPANGQDTAHADFGLTSLRKLGRSRMLVRFGPSLGLLGTLIPVSPALVGLAKRD